MSHKGGPSGSCLNFHPWTLHARAAPSDPWELPQDTRCLGPLTPYHFFKYSLTNTRAYTKKLKTETSPKDWLLVARTEMIWVGFLF